MSKAYGLNRTLGGAVALIVLTAFVSSAVVLVEVRETNHLVAEEDRSRAVLASLDGFRIGMLNQETGVRGFLLSRLPESLEPYNLGRRQMQQSIDGLSALLRADKEQSGLLREAEQAAGNWQSEVGERIVSAGAPSHDEAVRIESSGEGKVKFDAFRQALSRIEARERLYLDEQIADAADAQNKLVAAVIVAGAVTLLICAGVWIALSRYVATPLLNLSDVMRRLVLREATPVVPHVGRRDEVGEMARAVQVFRANLIELDRTALLRVTIDTLPAMVVYVTADRKIGFYNSEFAKWYGLQDREATELGGRSLDQMPPAPGLPGGDARLGEAMAGKEVRYEHAFIRSDGARGELEAYLRPHVGPGGRVLGVVALWTDISIRKELDRKLLRQARELQRSNEELEQFAYVASHDLKAPLRGIDNLVTWIEEDLADLLKDETRANMDLLKKRVKRLESLLDDLLSYSRAGRDSLEAQEVDARSLIEDIAMLVGPPEGFEIVASPTLPVFVTWRTPLAQIFQNLINNAIKHHDAPQSGRVWVEADDKGPMIAFTVSDNGPGIPEKFRGRVFGMFQTLRPRDDVEGSGMGLAIVKKLIERQGGAIWLTDTTEGRGLSVHFTWPAAVKDTRDGTHG